MSELEEAENTIKAVVGRTVTGGSVGDGGLHFTLDDGRILVVLGIVALMEYRDRVLQ